MNTETLSQTRSDNALFPKVFTDVAFLGLPKIFPNSLCLKISYTLLSELPSFMKCFVIITMCWYFLSEVDARYWSFKVPPITSCISLFSSTNGLIYFNQMVNNLKNVVSLCHEPQRCPKQFENMLDYVSFISCTEVRCKLLPGWFKVDRSKEKN